MLVSLGLTASSCGKGCQKSCNNCGGGSGGGCRVSVLGSVPSVLLSLLGGRPFFLGCCVRVAPVALSAFSCRCRICSGCLSVWGFGSARCVAVGDGSAMAAVGSVSVGQWLSVVACLGKWLCLSASCLGRRMPLSPLPLFQVLPLFFSSSPLKPPIIILLLYFLTPPPIIYYILLFINNYYYI